MISHREVIFTRQGPNLDKVAQQMSQRTGLVVVYSKQDWTFANPNDQEDAFGIYYEDSNQLTLTNAGPVTYLLGATLHTLVAMGGRYNATIPQWTAKRWEEVADKVKSLPRASHPDWLFD